MRKINYFSCYLDGDPANTFVSAYENGKDGLYYMRKKGPGGENIRYNPNTGILEMGYRCDDNSWTVYSNQIYSPTTFTLNR